MKKIFLMVMVIAFMKNTWGQVAYSSVDVDVDQVAFQVAAHAEDRIIFYDKEGNSYAFNYNDTYTLSQAKSFMSILLSAKINDNKVRVFYTGSRGASAYSPFATVLLLSK